MEKLQNRVEQMFARQLAEWQMAANNFAALDSVRESELGFYGFKAQYNPTRSRSTLAKTDAKTIGERKCFLCQANRPQEQESVEWRDYEILVNPYPVCRRHFTVPIKSHVPQRLTGRVDDMVALAREMTGYVVFFNGARCGASAPDHFHFQMVGKGELPFQVGFDQGNLPCRQVANGVWSVNVPVENGAYVAVSPSAQEINLFFAQLLHFGEEEMMNVLCWSRDDGTVVMAVFRRKCHRPACYFEECGVKVSPACVEMAGVMVTAREQDFEGVASVSQSIYADVCKTDEIRFDKPVVSVGVMSAETIAYSVDGVTRNVDANSLCEVRSDAITLHDVVIGKQFHWEQKQQQIFSHTMRFIAEGKMVTAVNVLPVEDYLQSVISSEMSAEAPLEFLKAHAIISRSWLLAQISRKSGGTRRKYKSLTVTDQEIVKWYDHDDHTNFDVCADDHCQRFQGIGDVNEAVRSAVRDTSGMVLWHSDQICDARFSKCCGGVTEEFSACWEPEDYGYLASVEDPYCDTHDHALLAKALKGYDRTTTDFYRWRVEYRAAELSALVREKSGIDFGEIIGLTPLQRGKSGRITRLRIEGSQRTMIVGKELEIRKWLSPTHLQSSAFDVEKSGDTFILAGKGWGHGVGLCQIGAAVMSAKGFTCEQILAHYYPGSTLKKLY